MFYDSEISVNQINKYFLDNLELLEPHGKGNEEPQFLIKDIVIDQVKNIKNKHKKSCYMGSFRKHIVMVIGKTWPYN